MYRQQKLQTQISNPELERVHKLFNTTIELLEKYIEVAYPNYEISKRIHNNDIKTNDPSKVESRLANLLFGLKTEITGKSTFFCDEIKQEFYQWLGTAKIDVNNCPERLRHFLFEFNEILERRGWKIERDSMHRKNEIGSKFNEDKEVFNDLFSSMQTPLENERFKSLESKNYEDIILENSFGGSGKKAEQVFKQMTEQYNYQDFYFFPQRERNHNYGLRSKICIEQEIRQENSQYWTNFEIIQDIKDNPRNWRLDKIPTEFDSFGRTKNQEIALIFNNNPLYRLEKFDAQQRFEIKKAFRISVDYLTNEEIKWVVKEVKINPSIWQFKAIDRQVYLVHNSAQIKQEEIGTLIHSQQKFNETEWMEINESLSIASQQKHLASSTKNSDEAKSNFFKKNQTCEAFLCSNEADNSGNYCPYHKKCLSKFRERENISDSDIRKLETFETWFSELCGYVISAKNSNYVIHFAFFEPRCRSIEEKLTTYNRTEEIYPFSDAENKANEIKLKLKGDNPILAFYDNSSYSISGYVLTSPEVVKEHLPDNSISIGIPLIIKVGLYSYPGNPDNYLKPLDVIKIKKTERIGNSVFSWTASIDYYHVGIYLGNNKVFHLWHPTTVSKMDAQIGSWDDFLSNATGDLIRYHTPIPFKHYEKVIEHIVKSDRVNLWYGKYDLYNRNCEHLVNVCKYGINWSEQIEKARFSSWWMKSRGGLRRVFNGESFLNKNEVNNGRSSSIILKDEIERSTGRIETVLKNKNSDERKDTRKDWELEYSIEVPRKDDCKIM